MAHVMVAEVLLTITTASTILLSVIIMVVVVLMEMQELIRVQTPVLVKAIQVMMVTMPLLEEMA